MKTRCCTSSTLWTLSILLAGGTVAGCAAGGGAESRESEVPPVDGGVEGGASSGGPFTPSSSGAGNPGAASSGNNPAAGTSTGAGSSHGAGSGTSALPMSSGGVVDWSAFGQQLLHQFCAYQERCAGQRGRAYSSQAACEADTPLWLVTYQSSSWSTRYILADPAACLAGWETLSCDGGGFNPACSRTARNPLPEGALCDVWSGPSACGDGLSCRDVAGCNRCVRPRGAGEACGPGCGPGLYCGAGGLCRAPAPLGSLCDGVCEGNLVCTGPDHGRTCQERRDVGEACRYDCFLDLDCLGEFDSLRCTRLLEDGEACTRSRDNRCKGRCYFATPDAEIGSCGPYAAGPGVGAPCAYYASTENCGPGLRAAVTRNSQGEPVACTCEAPLEDGSACTEGYQCLNYRCTNHLCVPPEPLGGACSYDLDCVSLTCDNQVCSQKGPGAFCGLDVECQSGSCTNYRCAATTVCQ